MSKLIQDIKPARERMLEAIEEEKAHEEYRKQTEIKHADNTTLIKELYDRGVTIRDIFGRYYEFDEMGNLTVEDVELAGLMPSSEETF